MKSITSPWGEKERNQLCNCVLCPESSHCRQYSDFLGILNELLSATAAHATCYWLWVGEIPWAASSFEGTGKTVREQKMKRGIGESEKCLPRKCGFRR